MIDYSNPYVPAAGHCICWDTNACPRMVLRCEPSPVGEEMAGERETTDATTIHTETLSSMPICQ